MTPRKMSGTPGNGRRVAKPRCAGAVVRAYDNLRTAGVDDDRAFLAATRIYRTHHPEGDMESARFRVASWIYDRKADSKPRSG